MAIMARRNASFYGPSRGLLGGDRISRDYMLDPRRQMAQQLIAQGSSTAPVQSPLEGLTRALTAGVGGYMGNQATQDMNNRRTAKAADMQTVLAGGQAKPWVNPDTGITSDQPAGGIAGEIAASQGMTNPDMQPYLQKLNEQQIAQEQAVKQAGIARMQGIDAEKRALADKMALKASPGPLIPGISIPFLPEVQAQKVATSPNTSIEVNTGSPTNPMLKAAGSSVSSSMQDWSKKGREAYGFVSQIGDLKNVLANGVKTGFGQEFKNDVSRILNSVGIEVDAANMNGAQLTTSLINQLVVPRVKQLGAKPTDRDLQFIVDQFPKLTNQEGGNDLILKVLELSGKRDIAREKFVTKWLKENAINDPNGLNFSNDYEAFVKTDPLFKPFSPGGGDNPAGVPQNVWDAMSPEDQALF